MLLALRGPYALRSQHAFARNPFYIGPIGQSSFVNHIVKSDPYDLVVACPIAAPLTARVIHMQAFSDAVEYWSTTKAASQPVLDTINKYGHRFLAHGESP